MESENLRELREGVCKERGREGGRAGGREGETEKKKGRDRTAGTDGRIMMEAVGKVNGVTYKVKEQGLACGKTE